MQQQTVCSHCLWRPGRLLCPSCPTRSWKQMSENVTLYISVLYWHTIHFCGKCAVGEWNSAKLGLNLCDLQKNKHSMPAYSPQAQNSVLAPFSARPLSFLNPARGHSVSSGKQLRACVLTSVQLCGDTAMKNGLFLMGKCDIWSLPGSQVAAL